MDLSVQPALSEADLARARAIRQAVFVDEQGVPSELELDGLDDECRHFLAHRPSASGQTEAVATARARVTTRGWKIERVAVLSAARRRSVGTTLVRRVLAEAPEGLQVYVHAQERALGFWQRLGFVAEGPRFVEGGIPHRRMLWAGRAAQPQVAPGSTRE